MRLKVGDFVTKDNENAKTELIQIRLTKDEKRLLETIRDRSGDSMSKIIRSAIKFYYACSKDRLKM